MLYQYAGNKKKKMNILPKWHRWKQEADFVCKITIHKNCPLPGRQHKRCSYRENCIPT